MNRTKEKTKRIVWKSISLLLVSHENERGSKIIIIAYLHVYISPVME